MTSAVIGCPCPSGVCCRLTISRHIGIGDFVMVAPFVKKIGRNAGNALAKLVIFLLRNILDAVIKNVIQLAVDNTIPDEDNCIVL